MKYFWIFVSAIGLISFFIGAAGMDSECLNIPVAMILVGCGLMYCGVKGLEKYVDFD